MRTRLRMIWLASLLLAGCSKQAATGPINQWIDQCGNYSFAKGSLNVRVSGYDGELTLDYKYNYEPHGMPDPVYGPFVNGRNISTTSTSASYPTWKTHPGWFVFVENQQRIWAYDGDKIFWLLTQDTHGLITGFGPRNLPCAVPQTVLAKLPDNIKADIKRFAVIRDDAAHR